MGWKTAGLWMLSGSSASILTGMTGRSSGAVIPPWMAGCGGTRSRPTGSRGWSSGSPVTAVGWWVATGWVRSRCRLGRSVTSLRPWSLDRVPVPAVVVSRLGVDQRWQRRGLGTSLMWHALELAAAVAPAVRARLVVAHGETERAPGFLGRFGFRAFDSDPRWWLPADAGR